MAELKRMSFADYSAVNAEHWSRLKLMLKSPTHYRANVEELTDDDTDNRILGRVFHMLVLEPQRAKTDIAVWTGKVRRGKEWDAFMLDNPGKEWIREKEFLKASAMADAFRSQIDLPPGGVAEGSVFFDGLKARPDYVTPTRVWDLKSCVDGSPAGFGKQAAQLGYHCQAALYVDAMVAVDGVEREFVLLACESKPPFVCTAYAVPAHLLEAGRQKYRRLLADVQTCKALDSWGGYATGVVDLQFPEWGL